jgi:hypothetical protein
MDNVLTDQSIAAWENDGGALVRVKPHLVGTENQIAWAEQIRANVEREFDRVAAALETVAARQTELGRSWTQLAIAILEEKRDGVMARTDSGYFIKDWQEMRDQVRLLVTNDARFKNRKRQW